MDNSEQPIYTPVRDTILFRSLYNLIYTLSMLEMSLQDFKNLQKNI